MPALDNIASVHIAPNNVLSHFISQKAILSYHAILSLPLKFHKNNMSIGKMVHACPSFGCSAEDEARQNRHN